MLKCIAFDCFGTVFDMSRVPRHEIAAYVKHVKKNDFTPYQFPETWFYLRAHLDSAEGIAKLQNAGYKCVALSNGSAELLKTISDANHIYWDHIVDLVKHRVYKPHQDAYLTIEKDLQIPPSATLMVTANPTFGDIEGSAAVGMASQVVRGITPPHDLLALADMLIS